MMQTSWHQTERHRPSARRRLRNFIMIPYTYLIGWSTHSIWYYGARWANHCNPNDLWNTYFTSSKHVKRIRKKLGEPDVVQIRRTFSTKEKAANWEHRVLRRIKARTRNDFLNLYDGRSTPFGGSPKGPKNWRWGKHHSLETRQKLSRSKIGHVRSVDSREKQSTTMKITQFGNDNNNAKPIMVDIKGRNIRFGSICEFGRTYDIPMSRVYTIFGNCQSHNGYFKPRWNCYKDYSFISSMRYEENS